MYGVVKGTQQGHVPEKWQEDPAHPQQARASSWDVVSHNWIQQLKGHCHFSSKKATLDFVLSSNFFHSILFISTCWATQFGSALTSTLELVACSSPAKFKDLFECFVSWFSGQSKEFPTSFSHRLLWKPFAKLTLPRAVHLKLQQCLIKMARNKKKEKIPKLKFSEVIY